MSGSIHSPSESRLRWILVALILALTIYLNRGWLLRPFQSSDVDPTAQKRAITPRGDLADDEETTVAIFQNASPSVVFVTTVARGYRQAMLVEIPQGTGSGFVWDDDGRIVTNCHVIEAMRDRNAGCTVRFKDGGEYAATLVGADPAHDIAVLRISAPKSILKPIPLGTSKDLLVGQKVFAIGNPLGYDFTLTTGVISALNRELRRRNAESIHNLIQTEAAISPGSSGGPLLDSAGRLIGMTTAIAADQHAANIGFAIPVDTINEVVARLIRTGSKTRVGMGVALLSDQKMQEIRRLDPTKKGVMIAAVAKNSAADKAGLRGIRVSPDGNLMAEGDYILAVDSKPVETLSDVGRQLAEHTVGELAKLTINRDGETFDVEVPVQAIP